VSVGALLAFVAAPAADAAPLPANCQQVDRTVTCTFIFTGDEQLFAVPEGVHELTVTATGASGGNNASGAAAIAHASLAVTPNSTLYVEVGGRGAEGGSAGGKGGFNGGGDGGQAGQRTDAPGGGGASDVRAIARAQGPMSLASRLIVAGGGGGQGNGAHGGNAGSDGAGTTFGAGGGKAGTATAGGAGGVGGRGSDAGGHAGGAGGLGDGGSGGGLDDGQMLCACGGGGGGGLYGGGGGGGGALNGAWTADGAGGGGGASLARGGTMALAEPGNPASVVLSYPRGSARNNELRANQLWASAPNSSGSPRPVVGGMATDQPVSRYDSYLGSLCVTVI
jgi:hypothetical protein